MILLRLLLEVCSPCQYTCINCAHQGLRDDNPKYQMSLEEVQALINHFRSIDTKIDHIQIHGPGEPLIWKFFNEGIRIMRDSGITTKFIIVTNGCALEKIETDIWQNLYLIVSRYPGTTINDAILSQHPGQWEMIDRTKFLEVQNFPHQKIHTCVCAGPSLYNGNVYPHCGPPLWDAIIRSSDKINDYAIPLKDYNPNNTYDQKLPCLYCWANVDMPHLQYNQKHSMRK